MSPRTEHAILAVILLVSSALSFALLTDGHAWGDDFAAYLMQGWSLLQGTTEEFVRRNTFTVRNSTPVPGPIAYPWGYPLLLAPVLGFLGVNLFVFPILPPIALIAADGGRSVAALSPRRIAEWARLGLVGAFVALSFFTSAKTGWSNLQNGRAIRGPFDTSSTEMFEFIREHTPSDSVVVFYKPRVLRLLTGRDAFRATTCEGLRGGDIIAVHRGQGFVAQVTEPEACASVAPRPLFDNGDFAIYRAR
jgi:hypothetical protein